MNYKTATIFSLICVAAVLNGGLENPAVPNIA